MALLAMEGFELFNTTASFSYKGYTNTISGGSMSLVSPTGRTGGGSQALQINASTTGSGQYTTYQMAGINIPIAWSGTTLNAGFALKVNSFGSLNNAIFAFGTVLLSSSNGNSSPFTLYINTAKKLGICTTTGNRPPEAGGYWQPSIVLATSTTILASGAWYWIDVVFTPGSGGGVKVYINGTLEINYSGNLTNWATYAYLCNNFDGNGAGAQSSSFIFDDLYVCDSTTSYNNAVLGPCYILKNSPAADSGTDGWTRSGGSSDAGAVNQADPSVTSSYVQASANATLDQFSLSLTSLAQTVYGVSAFYTQKQVSGAGHVQIGLKTGSTTAYDTSQAGAGSVTGRNAIFNTDPSGSAWTTSEVNSMLCELNYAVP